MVVFSGLTLPQPSVQYQTQSVPSSVQAPGKAEGSALLNSRVTQIWRGIIIIHVTKPQKHIVHVIKRPRLLSQPLPPAFLVTGSFSFPSSRDDRAGAASLYPLDAFNPRVCCMWLQH